MLVGAGNLGAVLWHSAGRDRGGRLAVQAKHVIAMIGHGPPGARQSGARRSWQQAACRCPARAGASTGSTWSKSAMCLGFRFRSDMSRVHCASLPYRPCHVRRKAQHAAGAPHARRRKRRRKKNEITFPLLLHPLSPPSSSLCVDASRELLAHVHPIQRVPKASPATSRCPLSHRYIVNHPSTPAHTHILRPHALSQRAAWCLPAWRRAQEVPRTKLARQAPALLHKHT